MLFNSFLFAGFFITVFCLYLALNHRWQNRMLLVASYIFYGAWDWRFLSLIFISTAIDYCCALQIDATDSLRRKKLFLLCSICGNISILAFFKYCNFFIENLQTLLTFIGFTIHPLVLQIVLPVGISFYTFQTASYTIDVYRRQLKPTKNFFDYALYVSFFPQLVAGPIERGIHLLPQVLLPRQMNLKKIDEGCFLIFWGLFQKMFIADNLARIADPTFSGTGSGNGVTSLLAVYAFTFQILCDFAGYSNIARGCAKCLGFEIMINFRLPYFAANPREFWQRWHISLSTWFRDYVYIPLGGNRGGSVKTLRNLIVTMFLCGLWHGAAWTFVFWGLYHGILLILHRMLIPVLKKIPIPRTPAAQGLWCLVKIAVFFQLVAFGWLLFRAQSCAQAAHILQSIWTDFTFQGLHVHMIKKMVFFTGLLLLLQILHRKKDDMLFVLKWPFPFRYSLYAVMLYLMVSHGTATGAFIYFQF